MFGDNHLVKNCLSLSSDGMYVWKLARAPWQCKTVHLNQGSNPAIRPTLIRQVTSPVSNGKGAGAGGVSRSGQTTFARFSKEIFKGSRVRILRRDVGPSGPNSFFAPL